MNMNKADIPIIVVTRNTVSKLEEWEWPESVKKLQKELLDFKIRPIIVDNGSSDITPKIIGKAISDGIVSSENVYWQPTNLGFAKAHNIVFRQLIAETECQYVATLNEDATADPSWLSLLVQDAQVSSSHKFGMWGGPIFCPKNHDLISSNGHYLRASDGAFLDIDWRKPAATVSNRKNDLERFSPCFAAALWSVQMLREVGLPDNDQFLYYDDVDLAYKARLKDWKTKYVCTAKAFHPLPSKKLSGSKLWKHQHMGRLSMVCRYAPDQERTRILAELTHDLRDLYDQIVRDGRQINPVCTNKKRSEIWNRWAIQDDHK